MLMDFDAVHRPAEGLRDPIRYGSHHNAIPTGKNTVLDPRADTPMTQDLPDVDDVIEGYHAIPSSEMPPSREAASAGPLKPAEEEAERKRLMRMQQRTKEQDAYELKLNKGFIVNAERQVYRNELYANRHDPNADFYSGRRYKVLAKTPNVLEASELASLHSTIERLRHERNGLRELLQAKEQELGLHMNARAPSWILNQRDELLDYVCEHFQKLTQCSPLHTAYVPNRSELEMAVGANVTFDGFCNDLELLNVVFDRGVLSEALVEGGHATHEAMESNEQLKKSHAKEVSELSQQIDEYDEMVNLANESISERNSRIDELTSEIEQLQAQLEGTSDALAALAQKEKEIMELRINIKELRVNSEYRASQEKRQREARESGTTALDEEMIKLKVELQDTIDAFRSSPTDETLGLVSPNVDGTAMLTNSQKAQNETSKAIIELVSDEPGEKEREPASKDEEVSELLLGMEQTAAATYEQHEMLIADKEHHIHELQEQLGKHQQDNHFLVNALDKKCQEIDDAAALVEDTRHVAQRYCQMCEDAHDQLKRAESEIEDLRHEPTATEKRDLHEQLWAAGAQIEELEAKVLKLQREAKPESWRDSVAFATLQGEIDQLKGELEDARRYIALSEQLRNEKEELEKSLQQEQESNEVHIQDAYKEVEDLERIVIDRNEALEALESKLKRIREDIEKPWTQQTDGLKQRLRKQDDEVYNLNCQIYDLNESIEKVTLERNGLEREFDGWRKARGTEFEHFLKAQDDLHARIAELEQSREPQTSEQLRAENERLRRDYKQSRDEIDMLRDANYELTMDIRRKTLLHQRKPIKNSDELERILAEQKKKQKASTKKLMDKLARVEQESLGRWNGYGWKLPANQEEERVKWRRAREFVDDTIWYATVPSLLPVPTATF